LKEEFEGKELDDVKNDYQTSLDDCLESLEEEMDQIKSGRASPTIFNDLEVKAYGEMQMFGDLAMTVVQGNNNLMVKVFDDSVKDEVIKTLNRSDFDLSV
jgi:ribosome recycling factor